MNSLNILFIGAGKMATAIAAGMVANGFKAAQITAYDISEDAAGNFARTVGARTETGNPENLLQNADVLILAVKPQQLSEAVGAGSGEYADKLVISIAAGVKMSTIRELCGAVRVIRVMPNTPALVGAAASAWCASPEVKADDIKITEKILQSVGIACRVDEKLMDAVTGVSGSGPAYVLDFIQALADGGVNAGLPRELANKLAAQTVLGTARLLLESGRHPAVLRDEVTSPGGTTAKALAVLEKSGMKGMLIEAVLAAVKRSAELGKR
ncbi:MAG: pyrroline-5-carboxylate reductase [Victivallales bacterium]|nr:pyrroline-5-carboxylate reductase [Victivallales bacterium]